MKTNTTEPTAALEETAKLTQLANFIQYRKQQKSQLINTDTNKNSLSKRNQNNDKNTKEKSKILQIFDQINEQLSEGHTVYEMTVNDEYEKSLIAALTDNNWASVIGAKDDKLYNHDTNAPIILQKLAQSDDEVSATEDKYLVWLHRQWYAEQSLAKQLMKIAHRKVAAFNSISSSQDIDNGLTPNAMQQLAIEKSSQHALSIIIGGPGTGKTFTVAKLVTTLQKGHEHKRKQDPNLPPLSITLTAPTGKAAQRMQESLRISLQKSLQDEEINLDNARTLHRLLGIGSDGIPRYHAKNPLPDDLIIVDEASMLGLELASQLVDAIKPTGRLILLGDANQLAAVDAGSVLSDLCAVKRLQPYITELTESKRFDSNSVVGQFALAIQQNLPAPKKIKLIHQLLQPIDLQAIKPFQSENPSDLAGKTQQTANIPFYPIDASSSLPAVFSQLAKPYLPFFALMQQWYSQPVNIFEADNRKGLFEVFDSYRILCAGHQGQLGTQSINQQMSLAFTEFSKITRTKAYFYHGLPIIIQNNDYQLGLFNGDIAICLLYQGQLYACFAEKVIPIQRLSRESCDYAYAMTIHKSQGSEFHTVAICIDKAHTRLLSQALIYTAVTRSKSALSIYSAKENFELAVTQKAVRQTGLQLQFDHLNNTP
ncbi:exodeoxyribonuclease V subunit alpha [Moraxella osloensis]|uniref:RecBCD enzyme subunit RecD n=1 Tax=Faucicola osloensis TaxID=34062 RepID=A0AAW6TBH6_FAUOS|nr:exodeoxyribonuclease V subunit alpha [Moraxella osloensis]MDI4508973.1 exodeoxyribonuclease V subunit alpha [Moraxella osloensis]